eukprot:GHVU01201860.1.p1 GENE.GHVU01201860.1~~GHVU01201860.1.p1  ORF type:complete len:144 (-),score=23.41 GHVU01201860.1:757-1188(-)
MRVAMCAPHLYYGYTQGFDPYYVQGFAPASGSLEEYNNSNFASSGSLPLYYHTYNNDVVNQTTAATCFDATPFDAAAVQASVEHSSSSSPSSVAQSSYLQYYYQGGAGPSREEEIRRAAAEFARGRADSQENEKAQSHELAAV